MGQARGRITQEEAEQYGIPSIMLLDNTNDGFSSSGVVSGSVEWTVRWDSAGFTGGGVNGELGWDTEWLPAYSYDWSELYLNGLLESTLESYSWLGAALATALQQGGAGNCTV